jgi:hypothetical protein
MTHEIPLEPVLQVIGTVAEINDPGRVGLEVLNARSSAVPFDIGSFNEIDLDSGPRGVFVASPAEEEDVDRETRAMFPRRLLWDQIASSPLSIIPTSFISKGTAGDSRSARQGLAWA